MRETFDMRIRKESIYCMGIRTPDQSAYDVSMDTVPRSDTDLQDIQAQPCSRGLPRQQRKCLQPYSSKLMQRKNDDSSMHGLCWCIIICTGAGTSINVGTSLERVPGEYFGEVTPIKLTKNINLFHMKHLAETWSMTEMDYLSLHPLTKQPRRIRGQCILKK